MNLAPVFTADQAQDAFERWGMNCGPAALAAVCGLPPDTVREYLLGFDQKRYTNPTMMIGALTAMRAAGAIRQYDIRVCGIQNRVRDGWPRFGLARVQWEGPWLADGVPIRARYRQTHWVGAKAIQVLKEGAPAVFIFDVNAMQVGGVVNLPTWTERIVPWLTKNYVPRADGGWHLTHTIEVER